MTETLQESAVSVLYRATLQGEATPVLLRVLRRADAGPRELALLEHEHALLRTLGLPGLGAIGLHRHDGDGRAGLVFEDPGGAPLTALLRDGPVDIDRGISIGVALGMLAEHMHQRGVIHKDIRPANLLWNPVLQRIAPIDFSIATWLEREPQRVTSPEELEGDVAYMSPEQTGRMNRTLDARTDLYSIGVTLYELFTGAVPFRHADALDVLHGHIARVPPPPHAVRREVPEALSAIVMKLLAKSAEERYQSGRGLAADLDECRRLRRDTGQVMPFPLGRRDYTGKLRIPERLYGRSREVEVLFDAFERARRGGAELLVIAGTSGVGKSALVNEIHRPIALLGGNFIAGKFDQLNRSVPFAPIARAFGTLLRRLLSLDAPALARYRAQIEAALGPNARLLTDLCPELELLLGPQPSVTELGPIEAQNRFTATFQNFLRVLATAEHPLVLFLDDLQWADAASLRMVQAMLTDASIHHLLILGAFRDNEVDAAHALALTRRELHDRGAAVRTLELSPLELSHVAALIADTLHQEPSQVGPLAALVFQKTQGNPLFVRQLLTELYREELLTWDEATATFRCDLESAAPRMVGEDILALMARKLRDLSPATQRLLGLAACLGHQCDVKTLAVISEQPEGQVAVQMREALHEGLLIPLTVDYRLMPRSAEGDVDAWAREAAAPVRARFLHDRVQEAAYALIAKDQEAAIHLRIGRLLWARGTAEADADAVFDVANHMNRGALLLTDAAERLALARLNLEAGRRAKVATAYSVALGYLAAGLALLEPEPLARDSALSFALSSERAECEYLSGNLEAADRLSTELLARATSKIQRAEVCALRTSLLSTLGKYTAAVESALQGLALFGIEIPEGEQAQREAMTAELAALPVNLSGRSIPSLIDAPFSDEPGQEMVAELLANVGAAAHLSNPMLLSLLVAKLTNRSIRRGHISASAYAYVRLGATLSGVYGRHEEAHALGQLGLALNERSPAAHLSCKLYFSYALYLHYKEPLRVVLEHHIRTRKLGLEQGDLQSTSFSCFHAIVCRLALGDELAAVKAELEQFLALMERTNDAITRPNLQIAGRVIENLRGQTSGRCSLDGDGFEEDGLVARTDQAGLAFPGWWYYTAKLAILVLHEDYAGAIALIPELTKRRASAIAQYLGSILPLYASLAMAASYASAGQAERARYAALMAEHEQQLARLAESCPENYLHKLRLVQAEIARIGGRAIEAMALYDEAITAARQGGFVSEQALASEVCARFYVELGRSTAARGYLVEAHALYRRWGATAKVDALEERYPHLRGGHLGAPAPEVSWAPPAPAPAPPLTSASLDMTALLHASQAMASDIDINRVLEQILRITAVTAGAQRGFLIVRRDGRLILEAEMKAVPDLIEVGRDIPLAEGADLATSLVNYVARSLTPVVLGDASRDETFGADPYIVARRPRSVLCMPLPHQGRLTGVLYLENNAAYDAFNTERVELLRLLSGQAASALENALLYARLRATSEELQSSLEQLREASQRLQSELEERARAEQARAALQEEVIRAQQARLTELSSPMIPITDEIVVMPLIGLMDAARGRQVLETALEGAQRRRARFVIVDITGVKQVDADVARSLVKTGSALRLLGVEAVLTGIRAEVAQLLVSTGVSLGALKTHGTLQSGIAYAMRRIA